MQVSIPFKRERGSKEDWQHRRCDGCGDVSIPFKRETISKAPQQTQSQSQQSCFHSLQTGNHIQSVDPEHLVETEVKFPFPSNGKAYPKGPR